MIDVGAKVCTRERNKAIGRIRALRDLGRRDMGYEKLKLGTAPLLFAMPGGFPMQQWVAHTYLCLRQEPDPRSPV